MYTMFEGAQPYLHPSYLLHQPSLKVVNTNVLHYQICLDIWIGVLGLQPHICLDGWTAVMTIIQGPSVEQST